MINEDLIPEGPHEDVEVITDLFSVIGDVPTTNASGFCSQSGDKWYFDWEDEIAKPALEALGYSHVKFRTGDGDSFGPLTRIVSATKDGITYQFMYS